MASKRRTAGKNKKPRRARGSFPSRGTGPRLISATEVAEDCKWLAEWCPEG